MSDFKNRLLKNMASRKSLIKSGVSCYRLYDRDIPEYPYLIDVYENEIIIAFKGGEIDFEDKKKMHSIHVEDALNEIFPTDKFTHHYKQRKIQTREERYEQNERDKNFIQVKEFDVKFYINPTDYIDVGLFLDHRPLRQMVAKHCAKNPETQLLNLFSYTGSFSVWAARNGADTVSVDLSKTYLNWAQENFHLNNIKTAGHRFEHADVFTFLKDTSDYYDMIVCDPPSFSNSKRLTSEFDMQRDHVALINLCMKHLKYTGTLYFSNNFRDFKMDEMVHERFKVRNITKMTIPSDFRDEKIHHCFEITFHPKG
jgi:23S rRNA (cytosine1962-C5)-methyltransferase/23S rRNA (guanine2445-N2)-methyltransferase / 23S rRNA (guanine2069-N7)-methyltransferase